MKLQTMGDVSISWAENVKIMLCLLAMAVIILFVVCKDKADQVEILKKRVDALERVKRQ